MATSSVKLPPGFQLETPGKQVSPAPTRNPGKIALPAGFQLESPEKDALGLDSRPLKPEEGSPISQKAKEIQGQAARGLGKVASRLETVVRNPFITAATGGLAGPTYLATRAVKGAVEHPREAAIAGGALALPAAIPAATGLFTTAALAGGGAAAGSLAADVGEKALGTPTAPKSLEESLVKAGKVGAGTTAGTLALGVPFKILGKLGGKILKTVKAANTKPDVALAQDAVDTLKVELAETRQGFKAVKKEALDRFGHLKRGLESELESSNKAIGKIEETTGLSKIRPGQIPDIKEAPQFARNLERVADNVKDASIDTLQRLGKETQEFFKAYPQMRDSQTGKFISSASQKIRQELQERLPELGKEIGINRQLREELKKVRPKLVSKEKEQAIVQTLKDRMLKARELVKSERATATAKKQAKRLIVKALTTSAIALGLGKAAFGTKTAVEVLK